MKVERIERIEGELIATQAALRTMMVASTDRIALWLAIDA